MPHASTVMENVCIYIYIITKNYNVYTNNLIYSELFHGIFFSFFFFWNNNKYYMKPKHLNVEIFEMAVHSYLGTWRYYSVKNTTLLYLLENEKRNYVISRIWEIPREMSLSLMRNHREGCHRLPGRLSLSAGLRV